MRCQCSGRPLVRSKKTAHAFRETHLSTNNEPIIRSLLFCDRELNRQRNDDDAGAISRRHRPMVLCVHDFLKRQNAKSFFS